MAEESSDEPRHLLDYARPAQAPIKERARWVKYALFTAALLAVPAVCILWAHLFRVLMRGFDR
jgi:hypothetical protein